MFENYNIEKKDLLIPVSILIGAIIIAGSICWSSEKIFSSSGKAADTQAQQNGQAADNGGVVKVTARAGAPTEGSGKVEIIEFSDFQCPFCQSFFNDSYKQIKSKYIDTGKVKFTFRHFPLPFHSNAQKASEAAECANKQGKFFAYHDVLFTKGKSDGTGLAVTDLKQYAADLGLNIAVFNSCLDNGETADTVKKDVADGQKAGVSGTPTLFINGQKIVGAQPFASFQTAIDAALK